ncbi:MAG: hypothetical protein K8S99_08980 [Planctomycetes bacterium]|nr:hypothetical protein [Planctomycetota bacterium]
MQTIELECPTCKSVLELDAGFAGGVCRCSGCGTLMTVPTGARPSAGARADRPDRPGTRPDSPKSASTARAQTPVAPEAAPVEEAPVETPAETETEAPPLSPAAPAGPIRAEAVVASDDGKSFRTASGRIIKLAGKVVPTAKVKRKVVRYGIMVTFAVIMTFLTLGTVVAVFVVFRMTQGPTPTAVDPDAAQKIMGGYDPDVNPFELKTPNMLGIPLAQTAVVILDFSRNSEAWYSLAKEGVRYGFKKADGSAKLQVIITSEQGMKIFPDTPGPIAGREKALSDFLDPVYTSGVVRLDGAIVKALETKPEQVVLVTSQALLPVLAEEITGLFDQHKGVKLDVITVNDDVEELRHVAERQGGKYVNVSDTQLIKWFHTAKANAEGGAK